MRKQRYKLKKNKKKNNNNNNNNSFSEGEIYFALVTRGPFIESPGNLTGPKSYFEI